uniref:Helix-turn-helix domain-containing protein n=1 Tax=Trichobilharzia regenti TaxID=157069 RepID=A0AA85JYM3_TRIRE|nr:unnamed protein product [Trichobilharzia regenti]
MEHEDDEKFHLLNAKLERKYDVTLERSVCRKDTWSGLYLNFNSFCPVRYKRTLVRTHFSRAKRICSPNKLDNELMLLEKYLKENGYPQSSINKYDKNELKKLHTVTASKKPIFIKLDYDGDDIIRMVNKRSSAALSRTYPAALSVTLF